jgi:superfamily II DNA or RNA helicase
MLTNNPLNIFGQARFIDPTMFNTPETPNLLGSFGRFREYFCILKPIAGVIGAYYILGYKNMELYNDVLNDYVYRVDSDEVLDLPEEVHKTIRLSWSHSTAPTLYKQIQKDGYAKYQERVTVADNVLVVATRLHQLTGGFIVTSDPMGNPKDTRTDKVDSAKLDALKELVEELDETEPAIIFAKYTEEIYHIAATLREFGSVSILSGQRDELKEWQQGKTRFIVVQTETGSEAIDLSRSRYTFIYSVGWSLANYEQMLRRMRRPRKDGKKADTVFYYHLIMSNTIDVEIARALREKKQITSQTLERITGYKNE